MEMKKSERICAWSKTKVNTYRWRLIASDVASDSPAIRQRLLISFASDIASDSMCRQRHRQRLNVSPATSPATQCVASNVASDQTVIASYVASD